MVGVNTKGFTRAELVAACSLADTWLRLSVFGDSSVAEVLLQAVITPLERVC